MTIRHRAFTFNIKLFAFLLLRTDIQKLRTVGCSNVAQTPCAFPPSISLDDVVVPIVATTFQTRRCLPSPHQLTVLTEVATTQLSPTNTDNLTLQVQSFFLTLCKYKTKLILLDLLLHGKAEFYNLLSCFLAIIQYHGR